MLVVISYLGVLFYKSRPNALCLHAGIVFDNLNGSKLRYTIRPAHEVEGEEGDITWDTDIAQPRFQVPGPRVSPKYYTH